MIKVKLLDYELLLKLNESSIQAGRREYLHPDQFPASRHEHFPVTTCIIRQRNGQKEFRVCLVLNSRGQTVWLDMSSEEFAAIPEVEGTESEWEWAFCAGTPPEPP